jgi:hypothetical protein
MVIGHIPHVKKCTLRVESLLTVHDMSTDAKGKNENRKYLCFATLGRGGGGGIVHFFNFCDSFEICRKEDCHAFADFPHWKIVFLL